MTRIYLVPVERNKKFERVLIEYFDSGVEKCDCEKFPVGAVANGQDVVGHFEGAGVDQGYDSPALIQRSHTVKRNHYGKRDLLIHRLTVAILCSRI
jgi:hypothetical protein